MRGLVALPNPLCKVFSSVYELTQTAFLSWRLITISLVAFEKWIMELRNRPKYNFKDAINGKRPTKRQSQVKEYIPISTCSHCITISGKKPKKSKRNCRRAASLQLQDFFIVYAIGLLSSFRRKSDALLRSLGGTSSFPVSREDVSTPYTYLRNKPIFLNSTDNWMYIVTSFFHVKICTRPGQCMHNIRLG